MVRGCGPQRSAALTTAIQHLSQSAAAKPKVFSTCRGAMRLTNPAASTAAKITNTMIFFMMFFRKARKRHVRPKDLLSAKKPRSTLDYLWRYIRDRQQRLVKTLASRRPFSHRQSFTCLNHNFAVVPNFPINGCRVLKEVPVSKEPIFAGLMSQKFSCWQPAS
jgi:hypothetical protein